MSIERCNAEIERIAADVARGGLNDGDRWGATIGEADWEAEKTMISEFESITKRFWKKVNKTDGCWLWTASKRNKGYGAFGYTKHGAVVQDRAHRFSWQLANGLIPKDMCVLHRCDVPACVNPEHLFLGTKAQNNADMISKGRNNRSRIAVKDGAKYPIGEDHHNSKLSSEQVLKIREKQKCGQSYSSIAKEFGIAIGNAFRIAKRKAWKSIQ